MAATSAEETTGVLLMAYGSPDNVDDLEAYLLDVRGGRVTPASLVAEIRERYLQIGGRSPLLERTREQAAALERELDRCSQGQGVRYRCYVGMRHWEPRIRTAVEAMLADGIHKAVALVMAPHNSQLSTGAYLARLDEAIAGTQAGLQVFPVEDWYAHPGFIKAVAGKAAAAWGKFDSTPYVIFSAHSLPERILKTGDPYDRQLRETCRLLAGQLNLADGRWTFCYQSAGQSREPWLGPQIETVLPQLAQAGERNLLVVPVGFVCDHVEVLYDIDIACRAIAAQNGARLERSESLNASPAFISTLASVVQAAVTRAAALDERC